MNETHASFRGMSLFLCLLLLTNPQPVTKLTPTFVASWFGINDLTAREASEMKTMITIAAHLFLTAGFFCLATLFYNENADSNKEQRVNFFKDVDTECIAEDGQDIVDRMQRNKLGTLVMLMATRLY